MEHCNSSGAPEWNINQATIDAGAKLCADIAKRHGLGKLVVGKNLFPHSAFSATACPGKLTGRLQEIADKANAINSLPVTPAQATCLYRVRKSWVDAASQKGAFKDLANAKKCADSNKGYSVFDESGRKVYPVATSAPTPQPAAPQPTTKRLTVQVNGLNVRNAPRLSAAVVGTYNKGATWNLPLSEKLTIADGWVWARTPIGYAAVGRNTGKTEPDDYILIS